MTITGDGKDYLAALSYVLEPLAAPRGSNACSSCAMSRRTTNGAVSFAVSAAWGTK